jgi:hypothetical protein
MEHSFLHTSLLVEDRERYLQEGVCCKNEWWVPEAGKGMKRMEATI